MTARTWVAWAAALWAVIPWSTDAWSETSTVGLVAHWDFAEGAGKVLHDRSGHGNEGKIHGARWVRVGGGHGLQFSRSDSYVDFGDNPALKQVGDFSFSAWVKPTAEVCPDSTTNWHLFFWETYRQSGTGCRLAGSTGHLFFRSNQADGAFQHGYSKTRLRNGAFHHVAVVRRGEKVVLFLDGRPNAEFPARDPTPNGLPFTLSQQSQSLAGIMSDVRLYSRALSTSDVAALYEQHAAEHGKDVSWIGRLLLTPFVYHDEGRAIVAADFLGVLPLMPGERIIAELRRQGHESVEVRELDAPPDLGEVEFAFQLGKLVPCHYEVCVSIRAQGQDRVQESVRFDWPFVPPVAPSPASHVAVPLPAPARTPPYSVDVDAGGGFMVRLGGRAYPVESTYTFPHGGENRLTATAQTEHSGEKGWAVRVSKLADSTYRVVAGGRHYRISREVELEATRVLVRDRIENLTGGDLGLALDNRIDVSGKTETDLEAPAAPWPPVFIRGPGHGLGLVPLNDVYQLLQKTYAQGRVCGAKIAGLGIARGSSHTLEWAVYPIGTTDYYDLVNAVRADEGLAGRTVDGCLAVTHSGKWLREPPPEQLVHFGGIKYMSSGCVTKVADDPGISFEGIEFVRFPKEREALRKNYTEVKKRFPDLEVGFHVAYNIYATDKPAESFPDSRLLAQSGRHEMYGNPRGYFSDERRAQGWAWYPYYPTLTNSFGAELLGSVDVMMDGIGANMVWADGLLAGYGSASGNFPTSFVSTLDPWDGHSVELNPATKTISRKWGQKVALGRDALLEYIRRINAKGGRVWINHMGVAPRSFAQVEAYWAAETNDGDFRCASLHLSPAPHGLAHPDKYHTARMIYDDIRSKLSWGVLYVYYWWGGAAQLTHRMITADMVPITIEQMHSGTISGRERIITLHSGVYGWAGDRRLHFVSLYDGRGHPVPSSFPTTVDESGARTGLALGTNETAVIVKIPVAVLTAGTVNAIVTQYDKEGIDIALNGEGPVRLEVRTGTFTITPGHGYSVDPEPGGTAIGDGDGSLSFLVTLRGSRFLRIRPEEHAN